jgi:hypothetical protein
MGLNSQQPIKGHFTELEQMRGRLLAWIRDQVRLKAFSAQQGALYTGGGTASCLMGNNSEPTRGELKRKGAIRDETQGSSRELRIGETQGINRRSMEMKKIR